MGFVGELVPLILALCLTVSGTNAQCEKEKEAFMGCFYDHIFSFAPLMGVSFCNRNLITENLCETFATIVRCLNDVNSSPKCRRDAFTQINNQMNSACKLNDLQEVCTKAPALDTGEVIRTTMSSSKAVHLTTYSLTTESSSTAITVQTLESTSVGEEDSSVKGSSEVPQVSMVLLMIPLMMLTLGL